MDKITLSVRITGEYAPRLYNMTGSDFDTMLAAVKALPERSFDSAQRLWKVRLAAIATLKEQGFEVKKDFDFLVFPAYAPYIFTVSNQELHVEVSVAVRSTDGTMPTLPQRHANIRVILSDEGIDLAIAHHNERAKKYDLPQITSRDKQAAYRVISSLVTEHYGDRLKQEFKKHSGKRTPDEIKAAKLAVKDLIEVDEGLDETGHIHPFTYEIVVVDGTLTVQPVSKEEVH